jgi:hypothetical protein
MDTAIPTETQVPLTYSFNSSTGLQPYVGPWPLLQCRNHFWTVGRTPWTSDQLVARPLPKHRRAKTQNKQIYTPNIHAVSGIRTHDPSVRASEDCSCLRPRGYCDRQVALILGLFVNINILKEEHSLSVLQNRKLRRISGPKGEEVTRIWRKLHNEVLHILSFLSTAVKNKTDIKTRSYMFYWVCPVPWLHYRNRIQK